MRDRGHVRPVLRLPRLPDSQCRCLGCDRRHPRGVPPPVSARPRQGAVLQPDRGHAGHLRPRLLDRAADLCRGGRPVCDRAERGSRRGRLHGARGRVRRRLPVHAAAARPRAKGVPLSPPVIPAMDSLGAESHRRAALRSGTLSGWTRFTRSRIASPGLRRGRLPG